MLSTEEGSNAANEKSRLLLRKSTKEVHASMTLVSNLGLSLSSNFGCAKVAHPTSNQQVGSNCQNQHCIWLFNFFLGRLYVELVEVAPL